MSQGTSFRRNSSTTVRSKTPLEFNKSLQLKHEIPLPLSCSIDLGAAGNESLVFCLFACFGGWQSRFFSCLWKDYMVIRGGPPHNYCIKEDTFSNKPSRQWQGTTKRRQMKILHKRHLKIHIKAHQPLPNVSPFTSVSAGNTLAVSFLIWDVSEGRTPKILSLRCMELRSPRRTTASVCLHSKLFQVSHVSVPWCLLHPPQ